MDFKEPDVKVLKQGYRETDHMYLISQGSCDVSVFERIKGHRNKKLQDHYVRTLEQNAYFGEVALVYDSVRTATVTCTNYSTLGKIKVETLYEICAQYPFFRKALINAIQLYDDNTKVFLNSVLRDVPYLKDCSEETIHTLALSMKQDFLEPGAVYFAPGDE